MTRMNGLPPSLQPKVWMPSCKGLLAAALLAVMWGQCHTLSAQGFFRRLDSLLAVRYHKANIDTAYVMRPPTKLTIRARLNMSGSKIETEGYEEGRYFKALMQANRKATLSLGASYLGVSLSFALNPAKILGKYQDYELNLNSYGRRFGFDVGYQDAKNFTGWYDQKGQERIELPNDILRAKTLNLNAYYVFNSRRFSYPAAFSQSYIQRHSAGSFMLAASGMWQKATLDWEEGMALKMFNISLGAGYGYNFVPGKGWLLHISGLPTFIVFSKASTSFGDESVALKYRFPDVIITGRGAVVYQWANKFLGLTMVYNYTDIGNVDNLSVYNTKWILRTFFGLRI